MTDQQLADRFEAIELPAWENDASFHELLLSLESVLPLRQPSEFRDPKVHQRILSLTEGVLVRICRLLEAIPHPCEIGIEHFGAHDLRRTCAELCRKNGGDLEQIKYHGRLPSLNFTAA